MFAMGTTAGPSLRAVLQSQGIAATPDGDLCVPTSQGGVVAKLDGKAFMTSFEASGGQKNGTWDEASLAMTIAAMDLNPECGNGVVEFPERCDAGENNGVPKLGVVHIEV